MDGASSIAGLLGLTALAAQTIAKTINALKTLTELPDRLRKVLEWLERLDSLLKTIQALPSQAPLKQAELQLLHQHIQAALDAVARLLARVTGQLASLNSSNRVKRQTKKVQIFLDEKRLEKDVREVGRAVESLHLCHSEISKKVLLKTSTDVSEVSQKLDKLMASGYQTHTNLEALREHIKNGDLRGGREAKTLEQLLTNLNARSYRLESQVRSLDANVTGGTSIHTNLQKSMKESIVAEIRSAILPELKEFWADIASEGINSNRVPTTNASNSGMESSETAYIPDDETRINPRLNSSSRSFDTHHPSFSGLLNGLEDDESFKYKHLSTTDTVRPQLSFMKTLHTPDLKHQITGYAQEVIFRYRGSLSWLGSLRIVLQRRIIATNNLLYRTIYLQISMTPNHHLLDRGLRLEFHWNAELGLLNSPTTIRLHVPRLLSEDDPIVELLYTEKTEDFIRLFRHGGYNIQDEIIGDIGSESLIDRGFHRTDRNYDICIFLLQQGAKLSFDLWCKSIGDYLLFNQDIALQITRLAITNGTDIESIPALPPILYEEVYKAVSAHPGSVPDWVILGHRGWRPRMCFNTLMTVMCHKDFRGFYDVARDNEIWKSFLNKVQADFRYEDDNGDTCWSALISEYSWFRRNQADEFVYTLIFQARMKGLLEMHADPCVTSGQGLTPTLQAFTSYDYPAIDAELGEVIGSLWISTLRALNINVTAVVRHSFRIARDNHDLLGKLNAYCFLEPTGEHQPCSHSSCLSSRRGFTTAKSLEDFLLDAFGKCGIYPDESWWVQEQEPNEWDLSATGVDFTPQSLYDAAKQDMAVKRRKGRIWQE